MNNKHSDRLLHTCAWCAQEILEDEDIFGFGAKASQAVDLSDKEGQFVSLNLALQDKTIFALIPSSSSAADIEGYDLIFITCSEGCAQSLKDALDLERDVFDEE
ncbi:MAG: hypothetical protein IMY85_05080 [Chloroflexi bacterium]|nr:hypothetical protein [Chloroflexota bacterium]